MYTTYTSSAIWILGTKGSLSFSFNDYSNLLNEIFDKNPSPSQCCSCCNCCSCCSSSFPKHRVPLGPSLFYGLRQSTFIQCSPCRRLIFGGRDRYYHRFQDYGLDHGCFDVSCSFKEKRGRERIERKRKSGIGRLNWGERRCLSSADDAGAVISFLSEELTGEYLGDRDRHGSSSKRVEMEKTSDCDGEFWHGKRKNVRLGLLESDFKRQFGSVTAESKREGYRRNEEREEYRRKEERKKYRSKEAKKEKEERETVARAKNHSERKGSSSFSSYYSLSSTGDFESDKEAQYEHVGLLEESSSGYKKELLSGGDNFEGTMVEEFERHGDVGQAEVLEQRTRTVADWELRKKTEKKLTEIEELRSQKESPQSHSRIASTSESDHGRVSSSYRQTDSENEKFLAVNFEKGREKQYSQAGGKVMQESQFGNYQEVIDINAKRTSQYQRKNLVEEKRGRYHETVGEHTGKGNIRKNALQQSEISEMGNVVKRNSNMQRQSESRMKIRQEEIALQSGWEVSEKRQQTFEQITGQIKSTRGSRQLSGISEIHDNSRKTSILQSETGMKNQEGSTCAVSHSLEETKEQGSHADRKAIQRIQSRKGSQDVANVAVNVTNVSVIHASDIHRVYNSQVTSERRMIDQGSESTPLVNPIREAREREHQTNESITGAKSRNEASSSDAPMNMVSQARLQPINAKEEDCRSSHPIMMPPSYQVVDRGSLHVDPVNEIATQDVHGRTSESSYIAFYTNSELKTPTSRQEPYGRDKRDEIYGEPLKLASPEGTISSAHRLEESSMKFVGEFMEMASNEALTSEIRKEKVSDVELEYEAGKDKGKSSSNYGSEGLQLKELVSKRSSGGSGEKGPDEMWDVIDPSAQEPPETEAPEGSTTITNTVVRRTGRSLWSIISDIVRLRWVSSVETPKLAKRSGGNSVSNDSISSKAWFSGHDPDEISDKNVERERSMPKEATSFRHQLLMHASIQGQEEVSDTLSSKTIIGQLEANAPSPSTILKSGSTSKGISTPSEEENLVWGQDRKRFAGAHSQDGKSSYVSPPITDAGESSSLPLPSSDISAIIVQESYGRGRTDASVGVSKEMMEQSVSAKSTEVSGSEGKDGELIRRRLQRNKQVVRDKFDEWEEAYIRESEQRRIDEMFMREALLEAKRAADTWEVPVGAVLVQNGKIIARGYSLVEELRDSTAHAEMICIREASNQLHSWRLEESTLYVTLEPCPMCAGAILQARIDTLVWGAPNKLLGADGSWIRLFPDTGARNGSEVTNKPAAPPHPFHPKMTIRRGILASECADAMQQFFQLRRRKKVKKEDLPPKPSLPLASHQSKFLQRMHDIFHALLCL